MSKRKLIRKIAFIAIIVFLISIVILIFQIPHRNWQNKKRMKRLDDHISSLTQQSQDLLIETAKRINAIPVNPTIISEIQSQFFQENQHIKQYLWMSDKEGEFIFGVPTTIFERLNNAFDNYTEVIKNDGHYLNRNDFLSKLVNKHEEIDFSEFKTGILPGHDQYRWRFYKESFSNWRYVRSRDFTFSSPVTSDAGEYIGELYLKVDDSQNYKMYYSKNQAEYSDLFSILNPIFGILAGFSGLILWFLLPTWVYIDAQQRDVKNPGMWAFLTLVTAGIFGLIIYLITRPQTLKSLNCPQCEKELNGTKAFCPYCGFDVSSTFCPQCQYPIKPDWTYCPSCRADLKQDKPEPEIETEVSS